ncbi:AMP-binding protein [Microbaculum marinum]|uniref:AMP-binding protein n=1 Tax=Microbaculum marinum TaxID=1764581 RepID=A0AAW9RLJ3_9HYPH
MRVSLTACLSQRLLAKENDAVFSVVRRFGASQPSHLTGADLIERARAMLSVWEQACGPGPKTVVLAYGCGELFLSSLVAGLLADITMVPIAIPRPGSQSDRTRHIVRDSGASAVFCEAGQIDNLGKSLSHAGREDLPCPVVGLGADAAVAAALQPAREARVPASPDPDPPVFVQYTSGSTRLPKGVRISAEQILANAALCGDRFGLCETTRFVNWLPHYHDMGLMGGILYPLLRGGFSAQMSPHEMVRSPAFWLRTISDLRATVSGGPAFAFAHALAHVSERDCDGLDLSSWATAFCGAEPVPADLLPAFRKRFGRAGLRPDAVFACYGLAEYTLYAAGESAAELPPEVAEHTCPCRLSAETRAVIGIFDPDSRLPVAEGARGEIWLRGPSTGRGYLNLPEESAATFGVAAAGCESDGTWLRTGDIGMIVGEWLYITGRIKDILIANGRKIAASELEWLAASQHDALNPAAAAAFMTDPAQGGHAVLIIERKSSRAVIEDPEGVKDAIVRAVAGEWGITLDEIRVLPRGRLARTSSGKIRRQAIAADWRAERQGAGAGCVDTATSMKAAGS